MIISCSKQLASIPIISLIIASNSCGSPTESHKYNASSSKELPERRDNPSSLPVDWAGVYEGTIGGRYAIRLYLRTDDTTSVGSYYYTHQGRLLGLRSRNRGDSLTLLEYGHGNTKPATAIFRLGLRGTHTLSGTWRPTTGQRSLAVSLDLYTGDTPSPGLTAHIRYRTELGDFQVPVVTVLDAGVTRLLRQEQFTIEKVTGLARAELKRIAAAHRHGEAGGYDGARDYQVSYNANGLLSLQWHDEMVGAANVTPRTTYRTLDLRTGYPLRIKDEIDPTRLTEFTALCTQLLQRQVQAYIDSTTQASSTEDLDNNDALSFLRSQQITAETLDNGDLVLQVASILLTYNPPENGRSGFENKNQEGFFVQLPFRLLRPYLRSNSALQRFQ